MPNQDRAEGRAPRRSTCIISGQADAVKLAAAIHSALSLRATPPAAPPGTSATLRLGEEVNALIRSLRTNGIEVTTIHSHMLDEQPRLLFMHFWANNDAAKLAKGLQVALDQTAAGRM